MSKIIKHKVAKKDVPAFEKMLGFKTTGDIEIHRWDKKTQRKIDDIMESLYLPKDQDKVTDLVATNSDTNSRPSNPPKPESMRGRE